MIRTTRLTMLSCLCVALVNASCAGRSEPGVSGQTATGGSAQDANAAGASADEADASVGLPPTSSLFLMFDDMDHDCPGIHAAGAAFFWTLGRFGSGIGNWFSAGGDAFVEDIIPPRGDSLRARHVQGDKLTSGDDLFVQLMHPQDYPVNLSPFAGIAFWARLTSPSGRLIVSLRDGNSSSGLDFLGAESTASPWFAQSLAVSAQWERFILLFDDFRQGVVSGNSSGRTLDTSAVTDIHFVAGLGGESFDVWIDDLAMLCRGVCPPVQPLPICSGM
jgi:hypothetical protein